MWTVADVRDMLFSSATFVKHIKQHVCTLQIAPAIKIMYQMTCETEQPEAAIAGYNDVAAWVVRKLFANICPSSDEALKGARRICAIVWVIASMQENFSKRKRTELQLSASKMGARESEREEWKMRFVCYFSFPSFFILKNVKSEKRGRK